MTLGEHERGDVLDDDGVAGQDVLEEHGGVVVAEQPDERDDLDAGLRDGRGHGVADVLLDPLTGHVAIDAERDPVAALARAARPCPRPIQSQRQSATTTRPSGTVGALQDLPGIEDDGSPAQLDRRPARPGTRRDDDDVGLLAARRGRGRRRSRSRSGPRPARPRRRGW